jgi:hypothetical protein
MSLKYRFAVKGNILQKNGADAMKEILINFEKLKKKYHITDVKVEKVE